MPEPQELTACVEFATGAVKFLGYQLATLDLTRYGLGVHPGSIVAMFRRDRCEVDSLVRWEQTIPGYYRTRGLREGICFYVALSNREPAERRLRCVIQALTMEGYLNRGQELQAYLGFGLAYQEER